MEIVKEIAATDVVTAARADSITTVAERMREENVGSVAVVTVRATGPTREVRLSANGRDEF